MPIEFITQVFLKNAVILKKNTCEALSIYWYILSIYFLEKENRGKRYHLEEVLGFVILRWAEYDIRTLPGLGFVAFVFTWILLRIDHYIFLLS